MAKDLKNEAEEIVEEIAEEIAEDPAEAEVSEEDAAASEYNDTAAQYVELEEALAEANDKYKIGRAHV